MSTGKKISLPMAAGVGVLLFILLILARCQSAADSRRLAAIPPTSPSVPVLMYHHLLRKEESTGYRGNDIVTYVEDFAAQLAWLKDHGFSTVTAEQLDAFLYDNGDLPERPVMITFDNGSLSNAVYGAPLLREKGYTAVIFVVTGKISGMAATFRPDRSNQLDALTMKNNHDVFQYASHTHDLHQTTGKNRSALTDATPDRLEQDLRDSLNTLSAIPGGNGRIFAYPYGYYNDKVKEELRRQGVRLAFRVTAGTLTRSSDPYALPRYPVSCKVSMEQFQRYFDGVLAETPSH